MSHYLVKVQSVSPKACELILNLDHVLEIAPMTDGKCQITMAILDGGAPRVLMVSDSYKSFESFVMSVVTPAQIEKKIKTIKPIGPGGPGPAEAELRIPTIGTTTGALG